VKTAIFLSIREKATRLPKKVLRLIGGRTTCEHLIARLSLAKEPDLLVMATSTHPDDDVLVRIARSAGIACFRGSEEDKLNRYLRAAEHYGIDFMVIVDGDDLFCSEEHIDQTIEAFRQTGADYISQYGLPLGAASFGVRTEALRTVCRLKQEQDTEVWGGYFTDTGRFRVHMIQVTDALLNRPNIRMTLDYEEDFRFFETVFGAVAVEGSVPRFRDVMMFLAAHPEVTAINQAAQVKYEQHLKRSTAVRMAKEP